MIVGSVEDDFDDIVQVLYLKCWKAMRAYDPTRSRMTMRAFVFMAMRNQVKDLQGRRRRPECSLDAVELRFGSHGGFEHWAGLVVEADVEQAIVEAEEMLLPNTLDALEREVVLLLLLDWQQYEVRAQLGIEPRQMEKVMRSVRIKLADWKPGAGQVAPPAPALAA